MSSFYIFVFDVTLCEEVFASVIRLVEALKNDGINLELASNCNVVGYVKLDAIKEYSTTINNYEYILDIESNNVELHGIDNLLDVDFRYNDKTCYFHFRTRIKKKLKSMR